MTRERLSPEKRTRNILAVAINLAIEHGYMNLTRHMISTAAGCSPALIHVYWATVEDLRKTVLRAAIRQGIYSIIAQGISVNDQETADLSADLRYATSQWIAGGGHETI